MDSSRPTTAFDRTIQALVASRNDAAAAALIDAWAAQDPDVADGVLTGLVGRRNKTGHLAALRRWHEYDLRQRDIVASGRGRISNALRDALLDDGQLFNNGAEIVEQFEEFDMIPTLVNVAEQGGRRQAEVAMQLVLRLVDRLNELRRSTDHDEHRRDPELVRNVVLESLERSISRFKQHKRREIVEAFVVLSGADCETLQAILDDLHHPCFQTVVTTLSESRRPGVAQLVFEFLKQPQAPNIIRNVVSKRADSAFIAALCTFAASTSNPVVRQNLLRVKSFEWLAPLETFTERFNDTDLAQTAALVGMSGLPKSIVFEFAALLLKQSDPPTRLAACALLEGRTGGRADELLIGALDDPDPEVQIAAVQEVGKRGVRDATEPLMKLISTAQADVRDAARQSLSEFQFEPYLAQFDQLDESQRLRKGALVVRVDARLPQKISAEMGAPTVKRRLRAIEVADVLNQLPRVADALVERLADDDHMVRAAAAEALQVCSGDDVRNALLAALEDRSAAVQLSAKRSLANLGRRATETPQ